MGKSKGMTQDWIAEVSEEIAGDPDCCDIQSSDAYMIERRIREAVKAEARRQGLQRLLAVRRKKRPGEPTLCVRP